MTKTFEEAMMMIGNDVLNYDLALADVETYEMGEFLSNFDNAYAAPVDCFLLAMPVEKMIQPPMTRVA